MCFLSYKLFAKKHKHSLCWRSSSTLLLLAIYCLISTVIGMNWHHLQVYSSHDAKQQANMVLHIKTMHNSTTTYSVMKYLQLIHYHKYFAVINYLSFQVEQQLLT